jgi:hypothetical protein
MTMKQDEEQDRESEDENRNDDTPPRGQTDHVVSTDGGGFRCLHYGQSQVLINFGPS